MASNVKDAALAIDRAVANLIGRDVEDDRLRDARCLLTSSLMRATGVAAVLRDESVDDVDVRKRVHAAFGAPGDWGSELANALRQMYGIGT